MYPTASGRAPRGFTFDPCHACGSTKMHEKGQVCGECRSIFKRAKQRAEELAAAGDAGPVPVFMQERYYALPHIHAGGREERDAVQRAFFDLGQSLSEPTAARPPYEAKDSLHDSTWHDYAKWSVWPFVGYNQTGHEWRCVRAMRPDLKAQLGAAYAAARAAAESAYREGHADGRNLLNQLAAGTMTMDEFNDRTLRREARDAA